MVPAVPVNAEVGLDAVVIDPPEPEIILHAPVPIVGVLPASVVEVNPHMLAPVWSAPAAEVVGFCWNVIVTSSVEFVQGELEVVHLRT